ncbi:hypothetical protein T03_18148 [Trichinella britovi]|uniref:Uncharacterized protein n=1 Tax=Trichinella britovi TaxID=45882 RepID=A0A0V1CWC7_TRIBR|nr:hypothetical protein T03_18148 [Trichinella britovi]
MSLLVSKSGLILSNNVGYPLPTGNSAKDRPVVLCGKSVQPYLPGCFPDGTGLWLCVGHHFVYRSL